MARRLPVYLLLDCSGSMSGEPIQCVREGVDMLCNSLLSNPMAMDTVHLSVITFASHAKEVVPLTNLFAFSEKMPKISASGTTAMGGALNLLADCVERDVQRKKSKTERGDYRPLAFLFTDGYPTDNEILPEAIQRVKSKKWGFFVACAGGSDANTALLEEITNFVITMEKMTPDMFDAYFKWMSDSIASSVQSSAEPPSLPQGLNLRKR